MANQSLVIKDLAPSDSGIYYCNSFPVAILMVSPALRAADDIPDTAFPPVSCSSPVNSSDSATEVSSNTPTTASAMSSTGGVSVVEPVLMFGGVGLAALMFLLATVAAGRAILHQA
ncbi:hypothetical protein AOLI_G00187870 [Acnodon oligacanthus]